MIRAAVRARPLASLHQPALRWAVPGAVVAIVLGAAAITAVTADAAPTLPPRTAAELLVDVQNASLTGAVRHRRAGRRRSACRNFRSRSAGRAVRTSPRWSRAPTPCGSGTAARTSSGSRCSGTLGESDLVRNGSDVWTWASDEQHRHPLPAARGRRRRGAGRAARRDRGRDDPAAGRRRCARRHRPDHDGDHGRHRQGGGSGRLRTGARAQGHRVAGRRRSGSPSTPSSTSRCGCRCFAKGAPTPAFEVGFTPGRLRRAGCREVPVLPAAGRHGHRVHRSARPARPAPRRRAAVDPVGRRPPGDAEPKIVGTGWTSVLVATVPTAGPSRTRLTPARTAPSVGSGDVPAAVPMARAARGASADSARSWVRCRRSAATGEAAGCCSRHCSSVLITDDGRMIAGAVAPELLYEAAAQ